MGTDREKEHENADWLFPEVKDEQFEESVTQAIRRILRQGRERVERAEKSCFAGYWFLGSSPKGRG